LTLKDHSAAAGSIKQRTNSCTSTKSMATVCTLRRSVSYRSMAAKTRQELWIRGHVGRPRVDLRCVASYCFPRFSFIL